MSSYDISWRAMGNDTNGHASASRRPEAYLPLTPALFHVLLSLADGEKHGYAILKEVAERTRGTVELSTGTLYGIIKRLLADGLIKQSVAGSTERRQAYRLTPFGRKVALAEAERLRDLVISAQVKKLIPGQAGGV
jgi:DNA-binding MarR family transcriptional regulator